MAQEKRGFNFLNLIPAILMLFAAIYVIGFIASSVYTLLSYIAIGLVIATAFINYNVILDYGKMLINMVRRNPIMGIVAIGATVFLYPIVALYLFGKAMLLRKVGSLKKQFENRTQGEYAEFEEIEDVRPDEPVKPDLIELPPLRKKQKETRRNDYEDLFEE